ncbi:phosphatidate phosphatase [Acrasis kona]|uniref:Phosphatidate phosphatase n=1 Tax=Acrasis kona TaxID=1008807 RepID=A0AAW2ZKT0_9EUKA
MVGPASCAMDIMAVTQKDGSIQYTPFYVRHGVIARKDKIVRIYLNGTEITHPTYQFVIQKGDRFAKFIEKNAPNDAPTSKTKNPVVMVVPPRTHRPWPIPAELRKKGDPVEQDANFGDREVVCMDERRYLQPPSDLLEANVKEPSTLSFKTEDKTVECTLFPYHHTDKIIISDYDGTITKQKNDLMSIIMTKFKWNNLTTRKGVADLYTEIAANGYKFVYISARIFRQMKGVKDYLAQDSLPRGPIITTPHKTYLSRFYKTIAGTADSFKLAVLGSMKYMFDEDSIVGAFGNKRTDVKAYRAAEIPKDAIYIVKGTTVYKKNEMGKMDDELFEGYDGVKEDALKTFPKIPSTAPGQVTQS